MTYQVGNICRHAYRSTGFYKVVKIEGTKVHLKRCRKDRNWSLSNQRSTYVVDASDTKLSLYDGGCYTADIQSRNQPDRPNTGATKKLAQLTVWECSNNIKAEFESLLCAMSPENLYCDGEASAAQARRTLAELNRKWSLLEDYIGFKVAKEY